MIAEIAYRRVATADIMGGRGLSQILTHLGEPLEPPPLSPPRGAPTDWGEIVQVHFRPGYPSLRRLASAVLSEISDDWEAERAYLIMEAR